MLSISGAIETLILKDSSVIGQLTSDFFKALGENKTLSYLNMDRTATSSVYPHLAKAIAMNAKKNGALKSVSIKNWFAGNSTFMSFLNGMKVSDYDHEMMYGDKKTATEMKQQ